MRAVVQRVTSGSVTVDDRVVGKIGPGMVVLIAAGENDTPKDAEFLAQKIVRLRIFSDDADLMNRDLIESGGEMLAVSQFTLYGDCRRGRRPSFSTAAKTVDAKPLYEHFVESVRALGVHCETGEFQAMMHVEIHNDGPITLLLDSSKLF